MTFKLIMFAVVTVMIFWAMFRGLEKSRKELMKEYRRLVPNPEYLLKNLSVYENPHASYQVKYYCGSSNKKVPDHLLPFLFVDMEELKRQGHTLRLSYYNQWGEVYDSSNEVFRERLASYNERRKGQLLKQEEAPYSHCEGVYS